MAWLLVLILIVVLLTRRGNGSSRDLEARVARIEEYLVKESGGKLTMPAASPSPSVSTSTVQQTVATSPANTASHTASTNQGSDAFEWLLTDWPMKAGALLILLAAGWFVSYAFANNWIGEEARIALGVLIGMGFLAWGHFRSRAVIDQGVVLYLIGATIIHLTLFAARNAYDMVTPELVLAGMFFVSVYLAIVSAQLRNFPLAAWGLFLAALAPFLVNAETETVAGLLVYSGVIAAGTIALSVVTSWRKLLLLSILPYALYSLMGMWSYESFERHTLFLIANAFSLAFAVAGMWYSHMRHSESQGAYDITAGAINAMVLFGWIMNAAPEGMDSLFCALWGLLYALSAGYLYTYRREMVPAVVQAGLATLFVGIATALELDGASLAIAFALEGAVVAFGALYLFRQVGVGVWAGAVFVPSILLSMVSILSPSWQDGVLHEDAFVVVLMGSLMAFLAAFARELRGASVMPLTEEYDSVYKVAAISACMYFLSFVWLFAHAIWEYDAGTAISLAIYALIGIAAYFYGKSSAVRTSGGILIGGVILRLLFVEVWQMDIAGRIITFFGIGALLLLATIARKSYGPQGGEPRGKS